MKTVILSFIKILFSLASKIAPKTTGRLAFRLFCTTFKGGKKSPQHQAILLRAQQQFTKTKLHMVAYSGGKVAAYEFSPSSPTDSRNNTKEQAAASEPNVQTVLLVQDPVSPGGQGFTSSQRLVAEGARAPPPAVC